MQVASPAASPKPAQVWDFDGVESILLVAHYCAVLRCMPLQASSPVRVSGTPPAATPVSSPASPTPPAEQMAMKDKAEAGATASPSLQLPPLPPQPLEVSKLLQTLLAGKERAAVLCRKQKT